MALGFAWLGALLFYFGGWALALVNSPDGGFALFWMLLHFALIFAIGVYSIFYLVGYYLGA